jgi:proline dehydrogenase
MEEVRRMSAHGLYATLDHLGENVARPEAAATARVTYEDLIDRLAAAPMPANTSLKLTQLGLRLDPSLCLSHLVSLAQRAARHGTFLRIDMEDSGVTETTLDLCRALREQGLTNVGTVIQSYLYRSGEDVRRLLDQGFRIRLVKGAYQEPASLAFQEKPDVDANFDRLCRILLEHTDRCGGQPGSADGRTPPIAAVATHDEHRIAFARHCAEDLGLPRASMEFQMLFGIRTDLQRRLAAEGFPVRVYVPFGTQWFPYFMRRLAERPANVGFLLRNLFRR